MRRSAIPRWPTVSWTGWCMPRPGSHYRESRCGRREVAAVPKRASRRQFAECFWALTPVALRAPYVSAQKHGQPQGRIPHVSRQRKSPKLLTDADHCFTLREPGVASLRSDRHEIGMTDRHHRNPQLVTDSVQHWGRDPVPYVLETCPQGEVRYGHSEEGREHR